MRHTTPLTVKNTLCKYNLYTMLGVFWRYLKSISKLVHQRRLMNQVLKEYRKFTRRLEFQIEGMAYAKLQRHERMGMQNVIWFYES